MKDIARKLWHLLPFALRKFLTDIVVGTHLHAMHAYDWLMDKWYRVETRVIRGATEADIAGTVGKDPTRTLSAYYLSLFKLRRKIAPTANDVFIDLGCGTGRVLFVFAKSNVRRARGIDFDPVTVQIANANVESFNGPREKVVIEQGDCAKTRFTDETIFCFCNPFGATTMGIVMDNIRQSLRDNPRKARILFYTAADRAMMDRHEWLTFVNEVRFFKLGFCVYENNAKT